MRRNLRNLGSSICLLACFAFVALWVRSYFRYDAISGPLPGDCSAFANSWHGRFLYRQRNTPEFPSFHWYSAPAAEYGERRRQEDADGRHTRTKTFLGFSAIAMSSGGWQASFPYWFTIILAGMLAAVLKPKPRWRFSLRGLFVILTLAAAGAAAIAAFARVVPRH
jgi:hypothetical protein